MSAEEFCQAHLKVAVAQICQNLGWHSTTTLSLEVLMDVTERFIDDLAKTTHRFSEQFGRTVPNLDDLGLAFRLKGIGIGELEEYVRHVEPVPFAHETVAFPAPKANNLQFPNPNSREILHHRAEHVHEHLPPMFPNMKEDSGEQQSTSAAPQISKNGAQENVPSDTSAPGTAGEKRPAHAAHDPLTPGKRPRVTVSSLPEEAVFSQYEMSSVIMAPDGTVLGLRGRGKQPEACPPPPTVRTTTSVVDTTSGPNRGVEGSDRNKENTAVDLPAKESLVRKEGPPAISGSAGDNKSKSECPKSKSKKKDKSGGDEKGKKQKKKEKESNEKMKIAGEKRPAPASLELGLKTPPKKPKLKDSKVMTEKKNKGKSPKGQAVKKKREPKKKATPVMSTPSTTMVSESGSESCLKDLLLSADKPTPVARSELPLSAVSEAHKHDLLSVASPESDMLLRQAFPPTDIFDNESCETSPQRLIIAEAEGRAQEKEEEKRIRLKNIDDTISAVIRDSAVNSENKKAETPAVTVNKPVPPANPTETPKKRGRPKKMKDKIKSSQFIDDDVIKQEKEDDMGVRSMKSINDTIEAVIRQGSEEPKPSSLTPVSVETTAVPASANIPTAPDESQTSQTPVKEGKKKKVEKDKAPGVKKKLKAKLQNKTEKGSESAPPQPAQTPVDLKPFVSDKFSNAKMKVFEFGDAESPPPIQRRPSQAEKEPSSKEPSPMPAATTPLSVPDVISPTDVKPIIKSPTPETAIVAASSASPSSAASVDQQLVMPLKIEIPKDKERHKEKSRDKEHRKDKKEKRRDKEKKKKNKDKDRDRDRDRHDKHHHEHKHEKSKVKEETASLSEVVCPYIVQNPLGTTGLKLKIKFGKNDSSSSSSVVVSENKSQVDSSKQLPSPTPRRESLKLVIRQDAAAEGPRSQKKYSSMVSTPAPKSEPRNTPPTLQPTSPLPGTPPPPVLSRNNSPVQERSPSPPPRRSPLAPRSDVERGRSPVRKSPPHPEVFTFTSPQSSPLRSRHSLTPPPRTPSTSPKSPTSSMPRTPSPKQHSPFSFSSPIHASPVGRKSPTPTPKTPSLSPAYLMSSPIPSSPVRQEKSPPPAKMFFSSPEHDTAPSSPVVPVAPPVEEKPEVQTEPTPPPVVPKPKGKVGRPRLKSPRNTSPKGKSPKSPKRAGKTPKAVKTGATGKSAGRGRPPKAKTLALRASLAAASAEGELSSAKPKTKSLTPPPVDAEKEAAQKAPGASSPSIEVEKSGLDSSSESPSPTHLSIAFSSGSSSRQRGGTVETETVGSYVDSTGATIWICPACKMQDDGSPMIGCDKCDDWYHWVCVNITEEPPEEESWFCPRCSAKVVQVKPKAKRGRKKKVH